MSGCIQKSLHAAMKHSSQIILGAFDFFNTECTEFFILQHVAIASHFIHKMVKVEHLI